MSQAPDDLELIAYTLINARLARGDQVFVFTYGQLRGKLHTVTYLEKCLPASTYLSSSANLEMQMEPCLQLSYTPGPRTREKVKDPTTFNFTRKAVLFNVPVRLVNSALFLQKLEEGVWFVNVNTKVKQ